MKPRGGYDVDANGRNGRLGGTEQRHRVSAIVYPPRPARFMLTPSATRFRTGGRRACPSGAGFSPATEIAGTGLPKRENSTTGTRARPAGLRAPTTSPEKRTRIRNVRRAMRFLPSRHSTLNGRNFQIRLLFENSARLWNFARPRLTHDAQDVVANTRLSFERETLSLSLSSTDAKLRSPPR